MAHYELVYENGEHSVGQYDTEDEMLDAVAAQHQRALAGVAGGPIPVGDGGHTGQRVVKVFKYAKHPADAEEYNSMSKDVAKSVTTSMLDSLADENGVVTLQDLRTALINQISPRIESGPHESNYKMSSSKSYTPTAWEGRKVSPNTPSEGGSE